MNTPQKPLEENLDLKEFIALFKTFFAKESSIILENDLKQAFTYLNEVDTIGLPTPKSVRESELIFVKLQKFGVLHLDEIDEIVKRLRYIVILKNTFKNFTHLKFYERLNAIILPTFFDDLMHMLDDEGAIKKGANATLDALNESLNRLKKESAKIIQNYAHSKELAPYLVDTQSHLKHGYECLLLKSGFSSAIKGVVLERSSNGYFYLLPENAQKITQKITQVHNEIESCIAEICQTLSNSLQKHLLFLKFIFKEFDFLDSLQARLNFAKEYNLEFVMPSFTQKKMILENFSHPILKEPKPLNLKFEKSMLAVTGVNAGGKTMLLKSLLSAAFLSKYLIPMKINANKSVIPYFKEIHAIINDPQNSANNISTFAGRMKQFSTLLSKENMLLGIDEIELGTDADEASSLYKTLLEKLLKQNNKIIITTHHKRLSVLMAENKEVELLAALYDEEKERPTYTFLKGVIGKSYAFETALRYGVPHFLIKEAKAFYGEDKERLNVLIENSSALERELKQKNESLENALKEQENLKNAWLLEVEKQKEMFQKKKLELEKSYQQALNLLKSEVALKNTSSMHKEIQKANEILNQHKISSEREKTITSFQVHQKARYKNESVLILQTLDKGYYSIETELGMRLKVHGSLLKKIQKPQNKIKQNKIKPTPAIIPKPKEANLSIDLRGQRTEEALDLLDAFLNNALLGGFEEVLICHGKGSGILEKFVKEFLKKHPKVSSFSDAPINLGGSGVKIVKL
ncbi:endonuclease MutS2 [Helicobacter cetorum]|uniref:endonuclease MutS2 n=1 Tax=Helicobacter cetorum TaxID=138563 RepID=UPI000CF0A077|nr:endonuclease MutS2 [Helicobacter cetorum]